MDVLADAFAALRIGGMVYAHSELHAPWSLAFERSRKAGFHAVIRGSCWLRTDRRTAIELHAGDVVVLPHGWTHSLSHRAPGAIEVHESPTKRRGQRPTTTLICGGYVLAPEATHTLLALLPPILHVRSSATTPEITDTVRQLAHEAGTPQPGSAAASARLCDLLLIYVLRAWLSSQPRGAAGWLGALRDPPIAKALALFHERPNAAWVLADIGLQVGLSRATLVRRFTQLVGIAPLGYLARWRMAIAGRLLRETRDTLADIGGQVGYTSEFAFNRAFKRAYRRAPGEYRKQALREAAVGP